jgi:hypothetical protein
VGFGIKKYTIWQPWFKAAYVDAMIIANFGDLFLKIFGEKLAFSKCNFMNIF